MIKVGIGYDAHQLAKGETFIIGGIEIPYEYGSVGHSDGDVLIHAIIDSLLGPQTLAILDSFFQAVKKMERF